MQATLIANQSDSDYSILLSLIKVRFNSFLDKPLFTTDASGLWDDYLDSFNSQEDRQHHNCHACRHFLERFGGLASIDAKGDVHSVLWSIDAPLPYQKAMEAISRKVRKARVTGIFLSSALVLGTPVTGNWTHFSATPIVYRKTLLSAEQAMAEKREDYRTVQRALSDYSLFALDQALALLQTESLYRSEKVIGPAKWLRDLKHLTDGVKGRRKENLV